MAKTYDAFFLFQWRGGERNVGEEEIEGREIRLTGLWMKIASVEKASEDTRRIKVNVRREGERYLGVDVDEAVKKFIVVEVSRLRGRVSFPLDFRVKENQ